MKATEILDPDRRPTQYLASVFTWLPLLLPFACPAAEGTLAVRAECLNGTPNGSYRVESAAGTLRIEGRYVDGYREGEFVFYGADGGKLIVLPYKRGLLDGTVRAWHAGKSSGNPDSGLKLIFDISAGFIAGRHQTWYENGERRSNFLIEDAEITAGETWNPDGTRLQINSNTDFLTNEIQNDFNYFEGLEQVMDSYPPAC